MLKTLRLHNFRTYLNSEVTFHPRHLLIGRNNSGKTNLCAALSFLSATARSDLSSAVSVCIPGGITELKNRSLDRDEIELGVECCLDFKAEFLEFSYSLTLGLSQSSRRSNVSELAINVIKEELNVKGSRFGEALLVSTDGREAQMLHEEAYLEGASESSVQTRAPRDSTMLAKLYDLETNQRAIHFRNYLSSISYFAISPWAAKYQWQDVKPTEYGLTSFGHSLALSLYQMKTWDEGRYRRVIDFVRENAEPELEAINFATAPDQTPIPVVSLKNSRRATWHGLSDGTIRLLALGYIVEASTANLDVGLTSTVILEEPENGVYPGQLRRLYDYMDDNAPRTQFIFTSHSPYFINFFDSSRDAVSYLKRNKERTEVLTPPPFDPKDSDRELLAEQYALELFGS